MDALISKVKETQFCQCSDKGRNLVVCIDGTSNQFGKKVRVMTLRCSLQLKCAPQNTNVVELYSRILKSEDQITYYNSGIGTYAAPSWKSLAYWHQRIDNTIDLVEICERERGGPDRNTHIYSS